MSPRTAEFAQAVAARLKPGSRVLEIGCGQGEFCSILRNAGYHVVALDPKAAPQSGAMHVTFEQFEAPLTYFDAVAMQLVLHHVADLEAVLDKIVRTLRPTGFVAIDDYGWERAGDEVPAQWKSDRSELHTSKAMLAALRARFVQINYARHPYFEDGRGKDSLGFTFFGTPAPVWPHFVGGTEKRRVTLAEHNPDWTMRFEMERRRIVSALGDGAKQIEHVGSTSVPGLAAKAVVDVLVAVEDPHDDDLRFALERAGYVLRVEEPGHRMYRTPKRDVHVHLWEVGSSEISRLLAFRNRLRRDGADRSLYERVKRELAKRDWNDVNDYAQAKTAVIQQILARAE